ncbi:nuclear transport factor 2 family protein [Paraburkholderia bengalensis]|uniref:Nuclear transport factor 2 family protein n=1 Tax=Paraburkholderia bengalensis TaxID=2747562 RepID=A0ABU8IQN9_9BURK
MNSIASQNAESTEPMSWSDAEALLAGYQKQWNTGDIDNYMKGFSDDVVVEFADLPRIEGKAAVKDFILARLARQKGYQLKKTLRGVVGSTIICSWTAEWTDSKTNKSMKGRGIEFIQIQEKQCVYWEATFNAWPDGEPRNSLFV